MRHNPRRAWTEGAPQEPICPTLRAVPSVHQEFKIPPRSFTSTPFTAEQFFATLEEDADASPVSPRIFRDDTRTLAELYKDATLFDTPSEETPTAIEAARRCSELANQVSEYLAARDKLIENKLEEAARQLERDIIAIINSAQEDGLIATNPELHKQLTDVLVELTPAA